MLRTDELREGILRHPSFSSLATQDIVSEPSLPSQEIRSFTAEKLMNQREIPSREGHPCPSTPGGPQNAKPNSSTQGFQLASQSLTCKYKRLVKDYPRLRNATSMNYREQDQKKSLEEIKTM